MRLDNPMVDFTTNIYKPEIIEILSLLVETLFDIDNLPSIKAYPKSPTGLPTHVLHEQWSECIELASDRCDPSSSLVINNPHTPHPKSTTPSYKHPCQRGILKLSCTTGMSIVVK